MENKEDKSFGVIPVFKNDGGEYFFCLVKHRAGHWGFPKGHPDVDESEEETAKRELLEETGINTVDISVESFFY